MVGVEKLEKNLRGEEVDGPVKKFWGDRPPRRGGVDTRESTVEKEDS